MLLVTVVAGGGPPQRSGESATPKPLANATVRVWRESDHHFKFIARAESGRLRMRVRPGDYRIDARLSSTPGSQGPPQKCESRTLHVGRSRRNVVVSLACQFVK
jgi:hypothetical protein